MQRTEPQSWACDRTRQAVSVGLDGELSQIERALMERHLDRCPSCAAFAADAAELTQQLRAAKLVPIVPIELPLRKRAAYHRRSGGGWIAAATVAATALLAVLALPSQSVDRRASSAGVSSTYANQDLRQLQVLRREQLKQFSLILFRSARGPQLDT
jgi:predicted anti-sigma-YlaC factor YlaD